MILLFTLIIFFADNESVNKFTIYINPINVNTNNDAIINAADDIINIGVIGISTSAIMTAFLITLIIELNMLIEFSYASAFLIVIKDNIILIKTDNIDVNNNTGVIANTANALHLVI